MKTQEKLFNKIAKKIAAFTSAVLILQPLLMVGVAPAQTFAATGNTELYRGVAGVSFVKDAFVKEDHEDDNFGDENKLEVDADTAEKDKRAFIWFDLSSIPEGATINSASLDLNIKKDGLSRNFTANRVLTSWIEDDINWDNQPSFSEVATDSISIGDENTVRSWNVTTDVAGFIAGSLNNYGWAIKDSDETTNGAKLEIKSSEQGDSNKRPKLTINYSALPTSNILVPEADTTYNAEEGDENQWQGEISGTASASVEGASIEMVEVAIINSSGLYWDGEGWVVGEIWNEADGTDEWNYNFDPTENDTFTIKSRSTDSDDDTELDDMIENVTYDGTDPTFESTVTPNLANQNNTTVDIEIVPSEELLEQDVPAGVLGQRVIALNPTFGLKLIINEVEGDPLTVYLLKDIDGKYKYTYTIESKDEKTVEIEMLAMDLAGNTGTGNGSFTLDNVAPGKVIDLKATAGDNKVELTWKNPTDADFAGVSISRTGSDGSYWESSALINGTSLIDISVKNGVTYSYDVYTVDQSGNKGEKASVSATPAVQTVAPASVNTVVSDDTYFDSIADSTPKEEIKAATDEKIAEDDEDKKDTEVKDESKFPKWGFLFLLILGGIGGYLFYVQKSEEQKKK